jgi:hypothetical protein
MNKEKESKANSGVIVDLQYFADIISFKKLASASDIVFDIFQQHEKRSFSNRCEIAGANGKIVLSVPLIGGRNQRSFFNDIRINNEEKWQQRHFRSIVSCYNGSPWFAYYADEMAALYNRPFTFLKDWNLECMEWVFQKMNLHPVIRLTKETLPAEAVPDNHIDLRKKRLSVGLLQETQPVIYRQVFQDKLGFFPGLSILDLLFCEGPRRAIELLR